MPPYRTSWDKHDRARHLLDAVGLAGRERSLPARMSGGEQQRVAIARALITAPALLLADEPTGNLDSATATDILDLLTRLRAEHQTTMILASHDPRSPPDPSASSASATAPSPTTSSSPPAATPTTSSATSASSADIAIAGGRTVGGRDSLRP